MACKNVIQPQLLRVLVQKAQEIVAHIDSGANIPEYLGHLHDATGVGIYADGAISKFIPTKHAKKLGKSGFGGVNHYGIDGNAFLQKAISGAGTRFAKGTWFVLFSAVPYAYHINLDGSPLGRGQSFFDGIVNTSVNEILAGLRAIPNASVTANSAEL